VDRSDDGGETWRATYFQDPRFQRCNVAPDWETASCGQCFKGGETPFGVAICNTDPNRHGFKNQKQAIFTASCLQFAAEQRRWS
jgi:hypothetical protein